jgi:hypothetical protein
MNPLMVIKTNGIRRLAMGELGPEKAGVGGSIPSLAIMFSATYRPSKTQFSSDSFQNFWPVEICLRRNDGV